MYKHSPIRNQRSKRIKIKHVVQLCLLTVVCFWLIFQLKRSYDKKKDFDHKITHADDEIVNLGRKDLQPKLEETATDKKNTQEQEDEEEEENKKEDEQEEDENKQEEDNNEDDENEVERSNMETDVDIIDEDKETDNEDEDGSTHEAREEHYKADDASSAVITTHDQIKNKALDGDDETTGEEKDSHENGPPPNTTTTSTAHQFDSNSTMTENHSEMLKSTGEENSYDQSKSGEYLETNNEREARNHYLR